MRFGWKSEIGELLYRLSRHSSGEAGVLARQVLVAAMEDIADDAERCRLATQA